MSETLIKNYQPDTVVEMKDSEELVDGYENQISNYLLALSHKGINEAESQKLSVLLYTVNDIETISDQVCNIGIAYRGLDAKENAFCFRSWKPSWLTRQLRCSMQKERRCWMSMRAVTCCWICPVR